ncbi:hypothetical protein HAX54_040443 [Datura stramonium]|uniref:Uncharacterized protein n=1 Tax=Datura stramonium TaxID=4076 RepID=A0ABS8VMM6_DATST|nr:hypothetical protein [Datura stramonium]
MIKSYASSTGDRAMKCQLRPVRHSWTAHLGKQLGRVMTCRRYTGISSVMIREVQVNFDYTQFPIVQAVVDRQFAGCHLCSINESSFTLQHPSSLGRTDIKLASYGLSSAFHR